MTDARPRALPVLGPVLVVLAFALGGVAAGFVWERLWSPPSGVVVDHRWGPADAVALQQEFSGTGWYVVVAVVTGLLLGLGAALLADRTPVLTLAAVVGGAALGAWLMLRGGVALGPADPQRLAATAEDGTRLPAQLSVSGWSPYGALPLGALVGLILVFIGLGPRGPHAPVDRRPDAASTT